MLPRRTRSSGKGYSAPAGRLPRLAARSRDSVTWGAGGAGMGGSAHLAQHVDEDGGDKHAATKAQDDA